MKYSVQMLRDDSKTTKVKPKSVFSRLGNLFLVAAAALMVFSGCKDKKKTKEVPPKDRFAQTKSPGSGEQDPRRTAPQPSNAPKRQQPPTAPNERADLDIDDSKLDKYVEAHKKVLVVQDRYKKQLSNVQDAEKAKALQKTTGAAIRKAVEETGMDFTTFVAISRQIQADPSLQKRVEQRLNKATE